MAGGLRSVYFKCLLMLGRPLTPADVILPQAPRTDTTPAVDDVRQRVIDIWTSIILQF